MLRDIRHPELVRREPVELAMHKVISSRNPFQSFHTGRAGEPVDAALSHQYRDQPTRTRDLHPNGELGMNAAVSVRSA